MTRSRWLGAGLFGLAVGLAATALLGPLGAGVIRYRVSGLMLSQLKGVDVVSLVLIAPLCAVIGLLAVGGRRAAPALALGPAVYVLYMFAETIVGPDHLGVAGNNQRFFPLFVAMFVLAAAVLITAWNQIDPSELGSPRRRANRVAGGLFVALGAFLVLGRYLPGCRRHVHEADQHGLPGRADHLLDDRPGGSRRRHPGHDCGGRRHVARAAMGGPSPLRGGHRVASRYTFSTPAHLRHGLLRPLTTHGDR
jgi:hypothetical protein